MKKPIYLDYAATTPVDPTVAQAMTACLTMDGDFGNPASRSHRFGWQAEELVDIARNQVAELIAADPREIIWTSGATEANNLVLKGIVDKAWMGSMKSNGEKNSDVSNQVTLNGHIITSAFEHKAVLDACKYLESKGVEVTYIKPKSNGLIDPIDVEKAIKKETLLISIMHVNNEVGTIQDIKTIGELAHKNNILFHVDAAQSAGKLPIDVSQLKVDFMSFSAHKIYGPKGAGALFARRHLQPSLEAIIHGGGHERGLRSGTLATHQIVGMGHAFEIARQHLINPQGEKGSSLSSIKIQFLEGIDLIEGVIVNGEIERTIDNIVNLQFENVDSEMLLIAFKNLAVSSGSACTSASVEPSYVLKLMGLSDEQAHSSLRFSFGRYTTPDDISCAVQVIKDGLSKLRQ